MSGMALRRASSITSTPERPACFSQRASAFSRMRAASWRLPPCISLFVNWSRVSAVPTSSSWYFVLRAIVGRRGIGELRLARRLGAVLGSALLAVADAGCIQRAAHDVVLHGRQVLDPSAAHQDHRVLLEVVSNAGDVRRDLHPIGQ